jgi:hypothetical protein
MTGAIMNHESAVMKAVEIGSGVLASSAAQNDRAGRFSDEAIQSLDRVVISGRLFRDAHAGAVMAPTGDVLREFIGKSLLGIPLF